MRIADFDRLLNASPRRQETARWRYLALLWVAGTLALGLVTGVCFALGLNLGATGFACLTVIVLLSLMGSLISSLIFSLIAVACLDFFFAAPIFSFDIANLQDVWRLAAFFLASFVITGLVRQLNARERQQTHLLDLSADAIFACDVNDVITYWNRGAETLYGWKRDEAVGKVPTQLLQTRFPTPLEGIKATLASTGRWDGELVHTTRGGSTVHVASRWSLQRDTNGEPMGVLETNTDISERRKIEEALLRSERRFRRLVQGITDYAIFTLDTTGRVSDWNAGAQRIKGYTADEIVGQHFSKFYPPDEIVAGLPQTALSVAAEEGHFEHEGWRVRKDGTRFWASVVIDAIKDDDGRLIGFAKITRDITERKRAEDMVRRSQAAYFAEAQGLSHTGSFGWDVASGELFWSDETYRIFGYDSGTKPTLELALQRVHPDDVSLVRQAFEQARENRQEFEFERRLVMPDGNVKTVQVRARALIEKPDQSGKPEKPVRLQFVGAIMDVSARAAAYAALERSEQRYRSLFQHMPISMWQLDAHGLIELVKSVAATGVTDFPGYMDAHPEFIQRAMEAVWVDEVNDVTVRMFGAKDQRELLGPVTRFWQARPDTFRRHMESRFRDELTYEEKTQVDTLDGRVIDVLFRATRADRGITLSGCVELTDLVRAQEKLERQAAYLAEAQRLSLTGSFGWNVMSGELFWSEEIFRIFDYDPATKPSFDLVLQRVHPDDVARVRQMHERAASGRQEFDFEHRLLMPDGTVKTLHVRAHALTGRPDTPTDVQFVGAVMDVTARAEAYAALERSERRYQNLFRAMSISFWEVDWSRSAEMLRSLRQAGVVDFRRYLTGHPDFFLALMKATRIVDVNDQTVALFGRGSKEEMLTDASPFWPEESWHSYIDAVISSINREPYFSAETRMRRLDGTVFDTQITVWYSTENRTTGFMTVTDISERKKAFADLERSEKRYRNLFQYMPISLWQLDTRALIEVFKGIHAAGVTDFPAYLDAHPEFVPHAYNILTADEVNETTLKMFGATDQSEILGPVGKCWGVRPDTFRRAMESRFRGERVFEEKTQVQTLQGRVIDVLLSVARMEDGITMVGIIEITELNRAQEKLQQLQTEVAHAARVSVLGELAASIAHEINQPLAAVAAGGETGLRWLERPQPNVAEAAALLRRVVADARRAGDIIARVQSMAARRAPQQVSLALHDVIDEALLFLRHELQSKRVEVSLDLTPGLPHVLGDRTQLQQVIVNLAINAVQAMTQSAAPRRILAVRTAPFESDRLVCMIEDSGSGIAPEHFGRLFESFFTTKEAGMGLGLAISRSIIEDHGGQLRADNDSPYGGARFSFTLPAADPVGAVSSPPSNRLDKARASDRE